MKDLQIACNYDDALENPRNRLPTRQPDGCHQGAQWLHNGLFVRMAARCYTLGSCSVAVRARRELHQAHPGRCRPWRPCTALAYTLKDNIHDWRVKDMFEKAQQYFCIWSQVLITERAMPTCAWSYSPGCLQVLQQHWSGFWLRGLCWSQRSVTQALGCEQCQRLVQGDTSTADALLADDFVHNDVVWGRQQLVAGPKVPGHSPLLSTLFNCKATLSVQASRLLFTLGSIGKGTRARFQIQQACTAVHPASLLCTLAWEFICAQAFKQFVANVREAYPDFSVWIREVGVCDTTRLFVHWQGPLP